MKVLVDQKLLTKKKFDHLGLEIGREYKSKHHEKIDVKPINCGLCLSVWLSLIMFFVTFDIFFLSLPLAYKLLNKVL